MSAGPPTPRVRPLGGSSEWPTATEHNVTVAAGGLELRALPDGPLGLNDPRDTLGGLIGPRWLALGPWDSAYRLGADGEVLRFDCVKRKFVALPGPLGRPSHARREIAVDRRFLAVLAAGELEVLELGSLARVAVLDRRTTAGSEVRSVAIGPRGPVALDADGRLWRRTPTGWGATPIAGPTMGWRRVAVDLSGAVHVLGDTADGPRLVEVGDDGRRVAVDLSGAVHVLGDTADGPRLVEVGDDGRRVAEVRDPREVANRFAPAPSLDAYGGFSVPFVGALIQRDPAAAAQARPGDPPAAVATHERWGTWTSRALDSGIYRCRWHRVQIAAGKLPPGTSVRVATACTDEPAAPPPQGFATVATLSGPLLPEERRSPVHGDVLIGQEGRYLWVRIDLGGDGLASPRVEAVKLHYPRVSALDDLPAVFSADAESRELVERMLAVFQTTWDGLEVTIDHFPRYFDPATIPEGRTRDRALERLAAWLAVRVEGDWRAEHVRRVLAEEGALAPRRGTLGALREAIALAVSGLPGAPTHPVADLPAVVEGYTQRERLVVGSARTAGLGRAAPLAPASADGRLRLGDDRLGKARVMAGPGSPEAELLARYAHRFSVSLPAAWVTSEAAEQMLRRAIDAERPAHVAYDLCLVEPRLRVGVQAAIGIDTVIAGSVRTVLTSPDPTHKPDPALRPPPSRQAHGRLGLDAVLVAVDDLPVTPGGAATPGTRRAGLDAVLA